MRATTMVPDTTLSATTLLVGSKARAFAVSSAKPPESVIRVNLGSLSTGILGSFTTSHRVAARKQLCVYRFLKFTWSTVSKGVSNRGRESLVVTKPAPRPPPRVMGSLSSAIFPKMKVRQGLP